MINFAFFSQYFSATRALQRALDANGFNVTKPLIWIDRDVDLEVVLLKRKRIISRRITLGVDESIEPTESVPMKSPSTFNRSILTVGRPNKGFRSISNRRQSTPQDHQQPIVLFDTPIMKDDNGDNDDSNQIGFDDMHFGRLED